MSEETPQFTNTLEYQIKLLAFMTYSPQFCDIAADALKGENFANKALQWYFNKLAAAPIRLSATTLKEELIKSAKAKEIRNEDVSAFVELYDHIKQPPLPVEQDHIRDSLGKFIRTQSVKRAVLDSFELIEQGEWDAITDNIVQATNAGVDITNVGHDYFKEFQDRLASRLNKEEERKLSTGIPDLDNLLFGGLKNKQLGLIVGGTGRGKSTFLEWLASWAVLMGKKAVYYTMELSEEDIADRFDSLFCHIKPQELRLYNNSVFKDMSTYWSRFGSSLVIKEYPADTATVNQLKMHQRQLASIGFIADIVVVDYLDLIKPHRIYNDTHQELDAITKALHGFSKEMNTRVWTATQQNRAGLVMETPDESTIAGAVAKLFTVDVAIFMAQTKEEREDEIMRLLISKNRNGPAGRTIKLDTDYSHMTFYRKPPMVVPALPMPAVSESNTNDPQAQEPSPSKQDVPTEAGDVLIL